MTLAPAQIAHTLLQRTNIRRCATAIALALGLTACSADDLPPDAPDPNRAPAISSATTASVPERSTEPFYTVTATDSDNDPITFGLAGGADVAQFALDTATGELSFAQAPDFENPTDGDRDNVYVVVVSASDGTASVTRTVSVTVTDVDNVGVQVRRVVSGLDRPVFATHAGDGTDRLFVVEQRGLIRILDLENETLPQDPFLDLAAEVSTGNEQGLLGLAFAPDFTSSGLFYVYLTNSAGDTEVREYAVSGTDVNRADLASERLILTFDQPFGNHNGGWMGFGRDELLYIASGDGGSGGDPQNNAQNTENLLGAILRIDPTQDEFPNDDQRNYAIPATNVFARTDGAEEIYAWGLRNPFRASFDRATGDLYIGDVGQDAFEEINLIPNAMGGQNFGWSILEGTSQFRVGDTTGLTPPVAQYPHDSASGFSVTGGVVHRGSTEALQGRYVFADFVLSEIYSIAVSDITLGQTIERADFRLENDLFGMPDMGIINNVSSFAEDEAGELYILDLFRGELFRVENDEPTDG